ncbi:hypothetical protein HPP92_027183, partial [Vanilla planifolia]
CYCSPAIWRLASFLRELGTDVSRLNQAKVKLGGAATTCQVRYPSLNNAMVTHDRIQLAVAAHGLQQENVNLSFTISDTVVIIWIDLSSLNLDYSQITDVGLVTPVKIYEFA